MDPTFELNLSVHIIDGYLTTGLGALRSINAHLRVNVQRRSDVAIRPNHGGDFKLVSHVVVTSKWSALDSLGASLSLASGEVVVGKERSRNTLLKIDESAVCSRKEGVLPSWRNVQPGIDLAVLAVKEGLRGIVWTSLRNELVHDYSKGFLVVRKDDNGRVLWTAGATICRRLREVNLIWIGGCRRRGRECIHNE